MGHAARPGAGLRALPVALLSALALAGPARAQTHLLVVSGLGGEPRFAKLFYQWGSTLVDAAARLGVPDSQLVFLAEDPSLDPRRIAGRSTRDEMGRVMRALATRATPDALIMIVMLGHGSDRGDPRLSLPGPDLSARELADMLSALPAGRVVVVNTASASGGFVSALSARGRVVVTATKSGFEQNHATFGGHFVEAFAGTEADADKDERVSLLEAFRYARQAVRGAYDSDKRLLTEHALLDDNGDGVGSEEPDATTGDGVLAAAVFLAAVPAAAVAATDPELRGLLERKGSLERQIAELRSRRSNMSADEYDRQLEALLVELAQTDRRIHERTGTRRP